MRVFLSSLIIFVLVGCNSAPDEVPVEESTVEVIADSVPLVVEETTVEDIADSVPLVVEVDTVETKVEEDEDLEVNAANDRLSKEAEYSRMEDEKMKLISKLKKGEAIRIHSDILAYFNFYDLHEYDGDYRIDGYLFTGVSFQTFDNGVVKRETDYEKGKKLSCRTYYQNSQICKSSEIIAYSNGPWNIGGYPPFGWDTYVELSNDLFFYQTGEKKGKYLNCIRKYLEGHTSNLREGKSWYRNGNLARQLNFKDGSIKDLKIDEVIEKIFIEEKRETVEKCFDEKGNEIDCEKVEFTECYNCDQPPLDK